MQRVIVITPPEPIVSLEQARRQLRIDDDGEDTLIEDLVAVATAAIDGPGGWLGRALGTQTLELRSGGFLPEFGLPYGPVQSVTSVTCLDSLAAEQTIASAAYYLDGGRFVRPVSGWLGSLAYGRSDAVRIRYVAGWPTVDGAWTGPAPIRHAILMMVTRLFAARGEPVAANLVDDPTVNALLAPWRVWSL